MIVCLFMLVMLITLITSAITKSKKDIPFGNGILVNKIHTISKPLAANINPYLVDPDRPISSQHAEQSTDIVISVPSNEYSME